MNCWCIMCSVLCVAYCQKDAPEHRTTPAKKPKSNKLKPVKSTNKGPRAVTAKPKIKPAQTFLTQVFHMAHLHFWDVKGTFVKHRSITGICAATCLTVWFGICHIQVLNRGKFKKVGETISVQTGDTLELRCRGKTVQWSVPSYLEEDHDGRLKWA